MKLIVFSDLHLVKPGEKLYGLDPAERLEICIADIIRNHSDADLCVIMGDLTEAGDPEAYQFLNNTLDRLAVPPRLLVGNHDIRGAFHDAFPELPLDENGFVQSSLAIGRYKFLFIDTLKEGTHEGEYCELRQAWLKAQLESSRDKSLYLFMHHPPLDVGIPSLDTIALRQKEQFTELLRPHAFRLNHIFFGHLHRPISGSWQGIPFTCLQSLVHQCGLDFDAKDQPPGTHEPPAYGIILIDDDNTVVHFRNFLDRSPNFPLAARPE